MSKINQKILTDVRRAAKRVYNEMGAGHEEAIYRDALCMELQDKGYTIKTEAPVSITYTTSKGRKMIVGSGKVDLYISKKDDYAIVELKAITRMLKENSKKTKEDRKEYIQLQKYLAALSEKNGILINFPFPPEKEPEIYESEV
jgi:GxxExxY protein|tara:strand:- start:184 stop:615 length:432 start_codon:yes stop_codon:yes gene_type:complete